MSSILVTCRDKPRLQEHYLPAIRLGGWRGEVRIVAPGDGAPALEGVRGLLLVGGNDIHPQRWNPDEALHPTAEPDPERDELEIPLVRQAWALGLPILGICRGEQLLNVALGGSLIQDIPSYFDCAPEVHRHGSSDAPEVHHQVKLDPTSRLAGFLGCTEVSVNSRHHQAVHRLAPDFRAAAWHPETVKKGRALIEAIEATDPERWVIGVQWHPENLVSLEGEAGRTARRVFEAFSEALSLER